MASATASELLQAAALWIGLGALALAAALFAAILVLRVRLRAQLARERQFAANWQPLLAACIDNVPAGLPALAREDGVAFMRLWVHAQESLRGEAQVHLVDLARRVGAEVLMIEMLGSGEPRNELLALIALGHLRLRSTLPLAESLLGAASPVISIAAAQALLRIDAAAMLGRVVEAAARRTDWPVRKVAAILGECEPDAAGAALAAAIDAQLRAPVPEPALARLLRLAGVASPEMMRPVLLRVLERSASPEAVAAVLDVLWHPDDAHWARRCAAHAQWFVRVAAAKALARIGVPEDRDLLVRMLSDPGWWVRYRSAQALARLPGMGLADLRRTRESLTDRYAADILGQVISEQGAP